MAKTSTGLQENVASTLCYAFFWVTGIIFLFIERDNRVVRFHAWQSVFTFAALDVLSFVVAMVPLLGTLLAGLLWLVKIALWLTLMIKAYQGEQFKLPIVGDLAAERV